jgi:hypothetical protein
MYVHVSHLKRLNQITDFHQIWIDYRANIAKFWVGSDVSKIKFKNKNLFGSIHLKDM